MMRIHERGMIDGGRCEYDDGWMHGSMKMMTMNTCEEAIVRKTEEQKKANR